VAQGRALGAAEGAGAPHRPLGREARRGPGLQSRALSRLPAQGGAARALSPRAPALAAQHLAAWLAWASRSKLRPFVKLARTIRR
jgi:hypothetical protein